MALKPLFQGQMPQMWDGYDGDYLTLKGGEVVQMRSVTYYDRSQAPAGADLVSYDWLNGDGYVGTSSKTRPCVTKTLTTDKRPLFLADEGTTYYGTLFGSYVGGVGGQVMTATQVGPSTAAASGKVTCWDKAGLYAVSLDAVDTTATTGLVTGNSTLAVGDPLYATTAGLLTPIKASSFETVSTKGLVVARFVEFVTDGSLVTTPANVASALNSPSGSAGSVKPLSWAVVNWSRFRPRFLRLISFLLNLIRLKTSYIARCI